MRWSWPKRALPGVDRSLRLFALGWRNEAVREWNFTGGYGKPGGLSDRELMAVAAVACDQEIWDRCINTSDKTRQEIDLNQRYPMPFKRDVLAAARDVGWTPPICMADAPGVAFHRGGQVQRGGFRAHAGHAGHGVVDGQETGHSHTPDMITDRVTNLRIGAGYLKLVLDDLGARKPWLPLPTTRGPLARAAGVKAPKVDAAAWVENIPFNETRDYVKKVLGNAVVYAHIIDGVPMSVRKRLGRPLGRARSARHHLRRICPDLRSGAPSKNGPEGPFSFCAICSRRSRVCR